MRQLFFALAFSVAAFPAFAADQIIVHVNGMVCDFCAQAIEKVMAKEPGIENVKIDLEAKTVTFTSEENADVTDAFIEDLMVDSGYDIERIERTEN